MDSISKDPWGEAYVYVRKETPGDPRCAIYSKGPDRHSHTHGNDPDDINSWAEKGEKFGDSWQEAKEAPFSISIEPQYVPPIALGLAALLFGCARLLRSRASLLENAGSTKVPREFAN